MGKLLILSFTHGEEQILDKVKIFLAKEPGLEAVGLLLCNRAFPPTQLCLMENCVFYLGMTIAEIKEKRFVDAVPLACYT